MEINLHIRDKYNLLKKLTLLKIINLIKLLLSFYLANSFKRLFHWGSPMTVSIEPTTACNLKCPECPSGLRQLNRPLGQLSTSFYQEVINQLEHQLIFLIFYFQGEPYLNRNFLEMVRYAHSKKIYTITSTNGHYLTDEVSKKTVESGLDRLIISVDGTTQDIYEAYRKEGSLEKVLEGARNIVAWKKKLNSRTPHLIFQFLVVKPNEHQISEIYTLAKSIGVNEVKLKTAQIYDYANGNPLIPTIEKYARYIKNSDGTYRLKYKIVNRCWKLWHACVVTWNGAVVPCCFDKEAKWVLGNLKEQSFKEIWRNSRYNNFRKKVMRDRKNIDICSNCSEGCKVWQK